jgi:hypothetical protein
MSHSLNRTSPKGGPFLGTCVKCGIGNIPLSKLHTHCPNPANITNNESLILIIKGSEND